MSLIFTGKRIVQFRYLKGKDISAREDSNGADYVLTYPLAKQQGSGFRDRFKSVDINEDFYLILKAQWKSSVKFIEENSSLTIPLELQGDVPIFLDIERSSLLNGIDEFEEAIRKDSDWLHMTEQDAFDLIKDVSRKNTARSERTGEVIRFTSRRFRYTTATNHARRGIGGVVLASLLDHVDTQNVDVYTENTEETVDHIDAVMAPVLAPLAQAFAGNLIASEKEALRVNDPHSRIKNNQTSNIGNCGTHAFCASGYRACYTCCNFQPWLDAPHEEVLQEILEEREHQKEAGVSEFVIQGSDRLLLAVQEVIQKCKEINGKDTEYNQEVLNG